ncbi:MAG: hypothetical protein FWH54_03590 [Methanobrevibacter sp.]|nr:hypothetical protein [Methanobrevibacter sp.]
MNHPQLSLDKNNFSNNSNDNYESDSNNPKKCIDLENEELNDIFENINHNRYDDDTIENNNSRFKDKKSKSKNEKSESKDYSQEINQDGFNKNNIDFEDLKENLNKVYNDPVLVDNTIRHIKVTIGLSIEQLWETGTGTKIINKIKGGKFYVSISNSLISRGSRDVKTPHMLHNHTSGIPLPHPDDMLYLLNYKIINSTISGNYGVLNMKNSFRKIDKIKKVSLKNEANIMFEDLGKKALDNRLRKKLPKNIIRKDKYKYYKENINNIIEDYNNQFNKYGIKFEYTPYKLKKR